MHAGALRPDGHARRNLAELGARRRGVRAVAVLPLQCAVHRVVVGAQRRVPISTRPRFSASNTLPDIRRFGVSMLAYTGKVLNYILATPEQPDDADNPLRLAFGNEASTRDITEFARRFGCNVRDSYGSTEGIIIIRRDASMPQGALGKGEPTLKVVDPDTGEERPPVRFGPDGRRRTSRRPWGRSSRPRRRRASRATTGTRRPRRPLPRRLVLVRRPRLPRRRRLAVLRGTVERVVARRR